MEENKLDETITPGETVSEPVVPVEKVKESVVKRGRGRPKKKNN